MVTPAEDDRLVRINGQEFHYLEKAPFAASGKSYKGALEYIKGQGYKCHECGEWVQNLSYHIKLHPSSEVSGSRMTAREYKARHAIPLKTGLVSDERRAGMSKRGVALAALASCSEHRRRASAARAKRPASRITWGHRNLHGKCSEQVLKALLAFREQYGSFPTQRQAEDRLKIYRNDIKRLFGVGSWREFYASRGWDNPSRLYGTPLYTKEVVIEMVRDFYVERGRLPHYSEWHTDFRLPSDEVVRQLFGGTLKLYAAAGLGIIYAQSRKQPRPQSHAAD